MIQFEEQSWVETQAVFDSLAARVVVLEADGTIASVNRAWRDFARTTGADFNSVGPGVSYLKECRRAEERGDSSAKAVHDGLGAVLGGRAASFTFEYPCYPAGEEPAWVLLSVTPLASPHGGAVAAHFDITPRKKAELALDESKRRLELACQVARMGLWSWDPAKQTVQLDSQAAALLGGQADAVTNIETLVNCFSKRGAEKLGSALRRAIETGEELAIEASTGGNEARRFAVRLQRDHRTDSGIRLGVLLDITELDRARERERELDRRIQHAQKLESLGVLAGGIAHDFNNLLMGVLGHADLALSELSRSSPARERIEQVVTATRRASELTNQMLAYSGKSKFVVEDLDLSELVEEMSHLLETVVSKRAGLKYSLASHLPPVAADASQIRQVVMNLITNASDAIGDKNGVITVVTGVMEADRDYLTKTFLDEGLEPGNYVYLEVSDDGAGMDEDTRKKIFDPFFTTRFAGRGLGLAAVLGIVRGHSGAIKVYSQPGQGTTVKVLFPAAQVADTQQPATRPAAPAQRGKGLILVVDDEESVRSVARIMLENAGFQVVTAESGREAVFFYQGRASEVRLIILDLTMPHMSAQEAFHELRRINSNAQVILSSAYSEEGVTAGFAGRSIAGFLQKPYTARQLREAVFAVVAPEEE